MIVNKLKLRVLKQDIALAKCGNRRRCVLAQALNRQESLGGFGYIRVDANEMAFTKDRMRRHYHIPRRALIYLRNFDELGARKGEDVARLSTEPREFIFKLMEAHPAAPTASRERKDQINAARRKHGPRPKAAPRYVGV